MNWGRALIIVTLGALLLLDNLDLLDAGQVVGDWWPLAIIVGGLLVPHGWRVDINGFPLFGGFENATSNEGLATEVPHLAIDATVLFGAPEVKH